MAIDIGELRGILTLQDQFSGPINGAAKQLGFFGESFGAVTKFTGLAGGAIGAAGAAIVALGTHGAEVADVQDAFAGLTAAAGESADVMLGALRSATLGTISDFDLMKMSTGVLSSGLVTNAKDMEILAAGAKMLADRTGKDTAGAFDTLTSAMASGRTASLKQLGLFVDTKTATEAYAKSLNKSVGDLSDHEKATALSQAALGELRKQMDANGAASADFGDNIARGKVLVQNFVDSLSIAIAQSPVVKAGMEAAGKAMAEVFGGKSTDLVKTLADWIGKFAIGVTYVGQAAIVAGQVLVQAFYAAKTVIGVVMAAIAGLGAGITEVVSGIAGFLQKIPGHAGWIDSFAESTKSAAAYMNGLTEGVQEEIKASVQGALGHSAASQALDKMGGVLINVRSAMQAAQGTQVTATEATKQFGVATTEAATRSEEASKKILDANRKLDEDLALIGRVGVDRKIMELGFAFDAEVARIEALKELKEAEKNDLIAKAQLRYQMEVEAAQAGSDEIRDITLRLQEELALAKTTGLDAELLSIEQHRQTDLDNLLIYKERYGEEYAAMVELVNAKYDEMSQAATGFFNTASEFAAAHGFKTREELAQTAAAAEAGYNQMKASGLFTYGELQQAHAAWKKAEADLDNESAMTKMALFETIAASASTILTSLFGKSKAAAIAAAIIDTLAAVVKTMAAYPWPFNLVPAAAAFAAGMVQVNKIRSQEASFATGTEGFEDFGRGTMAVLHGVERVQTQAQAIEEQAGIAREIKALRAELAGRQETIRIPWIADGQVLAEMLIRRNRAGLFRVVPAGA